jgi:hypothetical protein
MLRIKKAAPIEQLRFKDANLFTAQGYAVAHTEFGRGVPEGSWNRIYFHHDDHCKLHPDEGVSILLNAKPGIQFDIDRATATWCAALTVRTENKAVAAAVDALIESRRVWRDGVTTRHAPVRCTEGSRKTLHLFALAPGEMPFSLGRSTLFYTVPKTLGYSSVEVDSANQQFVATGLEVDAAPYDCGYDPEGAPFFWRGGLDLTQVNITALPIITSAAAENLVDAIQEVFEAHGAERVLPPC